MRVFTLWADIFYKYVFLLIEYDVLFKYIFSYFMKTYFNVSTSKYSPGSLYKMSKYKHLINTFLLFS